MDVTLNGQLLPGFVPTSRIVAFGTDGHDTISVDKSVNLPAHLDGGEGNDTVTGGAGHDVLWGGNGNDKLTGGNGDDVLFGGGGHDKIEGGDGHDILVGDAGNDALKAKGENDLLIGGTGKDKLVGGRGMAILIGGTTDHDADLAALRAIRNEWLLGGSIDDRIAHLTGQTAGGLNAPFLLQHDRLTSGGGTVHDDGESDMLRGSSATDWFFAFDFDALTLSSNDRVNHPAI